MSMRGSDRRSRTTVVSPRAFGWDSALVATLRHASLPWDEELAVVPYADIRQLGARDRISLLAQFAAHQALLQFAGVADGDVDRAEWGIVRKRGSDVRLVRVGARACDPAEAPPVLTLAQQFAEGIGAELDVLNQSWARADAIYSEAWKADLRWVRRAACGSITSPGPDGLRALADTPGRFAYRDEACLTAVLRFAESGRAFRAHVLRGVSPLERYSAIGALVRDRAESPAAVAEQIVSETSGARLVFAIANLEAFDTGSRSVVEILAGASHGTWLFPGEGEHVPESRRFVVAPRMAAAARLRECIPVELDDFVESPRFAGYIADGEVPPDAAKLPPLAEPLRSYVGALAVLGTRVERARALTFISEFLYRGDLDAMSVPGLLTVGEHEVWFESDALRDEATKLLPDSSRSGICRAAASHSAGAQAAVLWLEAGEPELAAKAIENAEWRSPEELVKAVRLLPRSLLSGRVRIRYANALVDCGRYGEAREAAAGDEYVLARAERRIGDYATALSRLERIEPRFEATILRAEILRLLDRPDEALRLLGGCVPATEEERIACDFERALHGEEVRIPEEHYLGVRLQTYRALERGQYALAARLAERSHTLAPTMAARVDSSLDRLFSIFSSGRWDEARVSALEVLSEVEETEGDRAAGGILFLLAYLAADQGQWAHASQRIESLRRFYTATRDEIRLAELRLLTAHLDFSRGRFDTARKDARAVHEDRRHHAQIREAAALILDEIDWMEGKLVEARATGSSGNAELTRRHRALVQRMRGDVPGEQEAIADAPCSIPERLSRFRRAIGRKDRAAASREALELGLAFEPQTAASDVELRVLRAAAVREYPFGEHDFDMSWCFATRNRLGQWTMIGPHVPSRTDLDRLPDVDGWIACSERDALFLEGSGAWSQAGREAAAALFHGRAEQWRLRRLLEQDEIAAAARAGTIEGIVGQSAAMSAIESLVARIAKRDVAVCVLGESGTGKELVARAIHHQSSRRQRAFTPVNCAALPENLVESELFGHVRGAFTGADRDRAGLIEITDGGTLFLDEVGELPLPTQAKLLRFLQEGEIRRVGDTANRTADVRIVSATNRKLDAAVEKGQFREDLYYRITGVELSLPPLRDRGGDVLLLATHFLSRERERHRAGPARLSPEVEAIFSSYAWPGNVREVQNTIRGAHAMAGEAKEITIEHLPERMRQVSPSRARAGSYQDAVARFRRELIERSLLEAKGNQNRAAALLKMSRQALAYQIRELGILVHV